MENEEVIESCGNIFEDLGYPNAEEALAKSKLAIEIFLIIKARKLTQKEAAEIMKTDQPHVSDILRGKLARFTIDRLLRFLLTLGKDIEIKIKKPKTEKHHPRIYVSDGERRAPLAAKSAAKCSTHSKQSRKKTHHKFSSIKKKRS